MAELVIRKVLSDGIYKVTAVMENVTPAEKVKLAEFGEPFYTLGGAYDPTNSQFLSLYFPDSKDLIPNHIPFHAYSTDDKVQFTDNFYYKAAQPIIFTTFGNWALYQSAAPTYDSGSTYSTNDVVYFLTSFYVANQAIGIGEDPTSAPTKWDLTKVIRKYTDNKYYKALQAIDFTVILNWVAGTSYAEGDYVKFGSDYWEAVANSPLAFSQSASYSIGDLVKHSGSFYSAVNTPRPGTYRVITLSGVVPSVPAGNEFIAGGTCTGAPSGATADIISWNPITNKLVVDPISGTLLVTDVITPDNVPSGTGSGTFASVVESNPAANTTDWQLTNKADPITDSGNFWKLHTDFEPVKDGGLFWELYTDQDPGNLVYWTPFTPTGAEPSSTKSFSVNQLVRKLPSGLPLTFEFDSSSDPEPEENARDFSIVLETDINQIWDDFLTNADSFTETEILPL